MKKITFLMLFLGLLFLPIRMLGQEYTPLTISGYNADVIANGTGVTATASTTNDVDGANYAYYAAGWVPATGSAPANGVPANRILNGTNAYPGLTFQLADYSENNSIRLVDDAPTATAVVSNGMPSKNIFLAATAGSGGTGKTVSCVVKFSDNTQQTAVVLTFLDWYSTVNPITGSLGRVQRVNGVIGATEASRIHQYVIPIELQHQTKTITSIEFTKTATGGVPNIFAVSAEIIPTCPSPEASGITSTTTMDSATVTWQAPVVVPSGGYDYYWTTSATPPDASTIPTGNQTGTSRTFNSLTTGTLYYFWVRSNCGTGDLGLWKLHNVIPGQATFTYTLGNIPTQNGGASVTATNFCTPEPTLTVVVPDGYWIASATTTYNMTATGGGYKSDQRSFIYSPTLNKGETDLVMGTGSAGVHTYNRSLSFAEEAIGSVDFVLRAWRTYGGSGCGTTYNYVNNNTWSITVTFEPKPPLCETPDPVQSVAIDGATKIVTITPATIPSTHYLIVRSADATLTANPVNETAYNVGTLLGGGTVVYNGSEPTFTDTNTTANTTYYYHVYAYNYNNELDGFCLYNYATVVSQSVTTCAEAPILVGESNVKSDGAILNWDHSLYSNSANLTYDLQVSKMADFSVLEVDEAGLAVISHSLTNLEPNTIYYWRVRAFAIGSCSSDWVSKSFETVSSYTPLAVTGYSDDVIADGIGPASASTTNSVDSSGSSDNFAYMSNSFKPLASSPNITYALPINRILESTSIEGLSFMIPPYSGNNSLRLSATNQSKVLTFVEPLKLTDLYFAFTSGSGSSVVTAEVQFEDGTSQVISGITLADWFATQNQAGPNLPVLVSNLGRVQRSAGNNVQAGGNPNPNSSNAKIFQLTVSILEENRSKLVNGVKFTRTSPANTFPNVFAVSGKIIGGCPILGTTTPGALTKNTGEVNWVLASPGQGYLAEDVTYTLKLYSDAAHTTQIGNDVTVAGALTHTFTGLVPGTTYYYTVIADNNACSSVLIEGSFTTIIACLPPTNLAVANVTLTTADISWNASTADSIEGYIYEIRTLGLPGSGAAGLFETGDVTGTSAHIEGLTTDTEYNVYVKANCGVDGGSLWVGPVKFTPKYCTPSYQNATSGNRITKVEIVETGFVDNIPFVTDRNRTSLVIPVMEPGATYSFRISTIGWVGAGVAVDFNKNGTFEANEIFGPTDQGPSGPGNGGIVVTIPGVIPADLANGNYRMRVWNWGSNSGVGDNKPCGSYNYGTWADYTIVIDSGLCSKPLNIVISEITKNSANISWTAPNSAPALGYEYEIRTSGTVGTPNGLEQEDSTAEGITTSNINGLSPSTTYQVYIRSVCDATNSSDWTVVKTFTTLCSYPNLISVTDDATICGVGTAELTASIEGAGTVSWFGSLTGTVLATGTSFTTPEINQTTTFYVRTENGTCVSPMIPVIVTVTAAPVLTLSTNEITLCDGVSSELVTITTGASDYDTFEWTPNNVTGNSNTGWVITPTTAGIYTLKASQSNGDCSIAVEVNVNVSVVRYEPLDATYIVCKDVIKELSVEGAATIGTETPIVNWTADSGLYLDAQATQLYAGENVQKVYFKQVASGVYAVSATITNASTNCEKVTSTIVEVPNVIVPSVGDQKYCSAVAVGDLVFDRENGYVYNWYTSTTSQTELTTISISGTYYLQVTSDVGGCMSSRIPVEIIIAADLNAVVNSAYTFCDDEVTFADIVVGTQYGAAVQWFATQTSTVVLDSDTVLVDGTTYYVGLALDNCVSARKAVVINVLQTPAPVSVSQPVVVCNNTALSQINLGVPNVKWYQSSTSTTPFVANTIAQNSTYYVATFNGICESVRVAVDVVVLPQLTMPNAETHNFCENATVAELVATGAVTGAVYVWYNSATSTTPMQLEDALQNATYYVSQKLADCESPRRAVIVKVTNVTAPQATSFEFCEGAKVQDLIMPVTNGVTYNWYLPNTDTPLVPATSLQTGNYFVSKSLNACESNKVIVEVLIKPIPASPTGDTTQEFVEEAVIADLVMDQAGVLWYVTEEDALNGNNPLQSNMPLVNGQTYYAVVIGPNGCPSLPTAVTVIITLGVNDLDLASLKYWPNPVDSELTVSYKEPIRSVEIYDILGKQIKVQKFETNEVRLDVSRLSAGTYMLKVQTDTGSQFVKIVKK